MDPNSRIPCQTKRFLREGKRGKEKTRREASRRKGSKGILPYALPLLNFP